MGGRNRSRKLAHKTHHVNVSKTARAAFERHYGTHLTQSFINNVFVKGEQVAKSEVEKGWNLLLYIKAWEGKRYAFHYSPDRNAIMRFLPPP